MVRCCIKNCVAKSDDPCHAFPKNSQMRKKWFASVALKPTDKRTYICYRHFKDSDYNCTFVRRRLFNTAIPSLGLVQDNTDLIKTEDVLISEYETTETTQEIDNTKTDLVEEKMEAFKGNNSSQLYARPDLEELTRKNFDVKDNTNIIKREDAQISKQETIQEIDNTKNELIEEKMEAFKENNSSHLYIRPDLEELTRKIVHTYKIVKLKKHKRHLKRYLNKIQEKNKSKSIEEKLFYTSIYRRSQLCYKFLSKYLLCPSITTLNTQLQNHFFDTGCNNIIFRYLKLTAKELRVQKDLYTILIWDEISLQPSLNYDYEKDKIIGVEDWGSRRSKKFADHAILFYMRCLYSGNHIPLGFGFCNGGTKTIQLVKCIKEWCTIIIKAGFKLCATVCDQGGSNIAAIKTLISESNRIRYIKNKNPKNTFVIKQQEIVPVYDYVHLQKDVRNNLLTKDLMINKIKNSFATWDDISIIYNMDKFSYFKQRQMPKLSNKHIVLSMIPKKKVEYATQVLSHTVANFFDVMLTMNKGILNTKTGIMKLPQSAKGTAEAILFFDKLFDSFNGAKNQGLTNIIKTTSNHISFWKKALNKLYHMEFVTKTSHEKIKQNRPKCILNWIWTIQNARYLWNILQKNGYTFFNLKYINQDIIENCFSQIRNIDLGNTKPSPYQCCASFKSIIITNVISNHSIFSNCEESKNGLLLPLTKVFQANKIAELSKDEKKEVKCDEEIIPDITTSTSNIYVDIKKVIQETLHVINQKSIQNCTECVQIVESDAMLKNIENALKIAETKFLTFYHKANIKQKLIYILNQEIFSTLNFHCITVQNILIDTVAQKFILHWCIYINKILNGMQESSDNFIYNEATKLSLKYRNYKRFKPT